MTNVMTPSEHITSGQIGKFQELLGAALRKSGLSSGPVQQVLESTGGELVTGLVAKLRTAVEAIAAMFSRHVVVNLARSPQEALDATGRIQYVDATVVAAMPKGQVQEEVFFFKLGRFVSDSNLDEEYAARILKPASPYSLAQVNADDPAFADEHPNGTHWQDANGHWCYATFSRWHGERSVYVRRGDGGWCGSWWFAGVRK